MMSRRAEALLELEPGAKLDDAVGPHVDIHQRLPPRLVIVAADEEALRGLESNPKVRAVFTGDVPQETLERLDEPERLFAGGWNERRRPKQRPGDGLPWDAPGFDAP
jgi:hypothetical protein